VDYDLGDREWVYGEDGFERFLVNSFLRVGGVVRYQGSLGECFGSGGFREVVRCCVVAEVWKDRGGGDDKDFLGVLRRFLEYSGGDIRWLSIEDERVGWEVISLFKRRIWGDLKRDVGDGRKEEIKGGRVLRDIPIR
jgi:hypothetical protein